MQLEKVSSDAYRITLHTYELSALVTAARWVAEGAEGGLPPEATEQLSKVLAAYDTEVKRVNKQDEQS